MQRVTMMRRGLASALCWLLANQAFGVEAPTGIGNVTNGVLNQTDFNAAITLFNQDQTAATGLGPVFNDNSCGRCHRAPVPGGSGASRAHRAGVFDGVNFIEPPGVP